MASSIVLLSASFLLAAPVFGSKDLQPPTPDFDYAYVIPALASEEWDLSTKSPKEAVVELANRELENEDSDLFKLVKKAFPGKSAISVMSELYKVTSSDILELHEGSVPGMKYKNYMVALRMDLRDTKSRVFKFVRARVFVPTDRSVSKGHVDLLSVHGRRSSCGSLLE